MSIWKIKYHLTYLRSIKELERFVENTLRQVVDEKNETRKHYNYVKFYNINVIKVNVSIENLKAITSISIRLLKF